MEQKVKKRTWVKDAAIIFLAVLLVLTFFSNTILNRSLPEVATVMAEPGSIDSKVRVSGTVSAKENYDVVLEQSRKVASVSARVGQEVSAGDLLFTLEPGDSDELETAKDALHALELQYRKAAVSADSSDYTRENRSIALAQADLERAQAKYDRYALTPEGLTTLETAIESTERQVKSLQRQVEAAQTGMNNSSDGAGWSGGGASTAMENRVNTARAALIEAENACNAAHLAYDADYHALQATAESQIETDYDAAHGPGAFAALSEEEQEAKLGALLPYYLQKLAKGKAADDPQRVAYEKITAAEDARASAQQELADAQAAVNDANSSGSFESDTFYQGKNHSYWVKEYNELKTKLDKEQATLDGYKEKKTNYEEALAGLDTAEKALRTLQDALEDAQKADRLAAIDLQELQYQIAAAKADIEKLSGGDTGTEVRAKVNGTVQNLTVSAGHTANAGDVLATIEVPDLGYTMNASVTNDQARLLHVGDTAEVGNFYWGSSTTAELTAIRPDPKNPQGGKLLLFDLRGDVTAGSTLKFSIGEKNASYDLVVPNSAVRSDTNGKFVLIITAKNSPLGNRYYATRVDVNVIAEDEHFSAVSGTLEQGDSVITTATANAPIKNGDMVRLADNQV